MSFIYDGLNEKQHLVLDFFFHGRGAPLQKTPVGMFRSLLHQLFSKIPRTRQQIGAAFGEKKVFGEAGVAWEWQHKELRVIFSKALLYAAKSSTFTIFIDALDEAGPEAAEEIARYFHDLHDNIKVGQGAVRICMSCRHYPIVAVYPGQSVVLEDENHDDIETYVKGELELGFQTQGIAATLSANECINLEEIIVERASGVFQWARLVIPLIIKLVRHGKSYSYINQEITKVPPELGDVYKHIVSVVIEKRDRNRALHLMQWVCLAIRPLTVKELRFAMASDDDFVGKSYKFCRDANDLVDSDQQMVKLITSLSGGLAEVYSVDSTVQVIHQSVNDFLRSDGGLNYLASLSKDYSRYSASVSTMAPLELILGQSHDRLRSACVNYLRSEEVLFAFSEISSLEQYSEEWDWAKSHFGDKFPFTAYAVTSWFLHAEEAERREISQVELLEFEIDSRQAFKEWLNIFEHLDEYNRKRPQLASTLLHVASSSNLGSVVQNILRKDVTSVNMQDDGGNRALHNAAYWGHVEVVKMLLDAGADVSTKNKRNTTALASAAANGNIETLQLLLQKGIGLNEYIGDALQEAAGSGNIIFVRLLLKKGADVNAIGGYYGNALQAASYGGHEEVINLLLEKGADINAIGGEYGSALQAASYGGHEKIINLLLEKGADINAIGGDYGSTLQAASYGGHEEVIKLLLEKGTDINAIGGEYGSALQAASVEGHMDIIKLLLEKGADVNVTGGEFGSALQAASYWSYEDVIKLLLEKGADVNAIGGEYGSALQVASAHGNKEIIKLLLEKGADVNAIGGEYGSALQAASAQGNKEIIKLLLEKGADIDAIGGEYGSALQAASAKRHKEIVKLLLEKGADINAKGGKYGSALQAASVEGHMDIIKLLLEKGADVNVTGGEFGSALQAASYWSYEDVIKLLLEKGADVNAIGREYGSALQVASAHGNKEITKLLLEKGADVNAIGGEYGSALQAASAQGNKEIVKLLLENGAKEV